MLTQLHTIPQICYRKALQKSGAEPTLKNGLNSQK